MKVSDLFVSCLEEEGVEYVFGLPGEETESLLFSLHDSSITFVPVRHEQGAAFMADVHGRLTGEAGVCLATLGPGATNLLTGVADAQLDKSPVVAVTAQGSRERLHHESHQRLNIVDIFDPVTKWNAQISDGDTTAESVRKAFKVAEYAKPGATHLELPEDVADVDTDAQRLTPASVPRSAPNRAALERVVELLRNSDRPLLLAGNGVLRAGATESARELVEATDLPVVSTYMGKGVVSDADERSLYTLDSGANADAARAVDDADLVLAVGYDVAEHPPESWNPDGATQLVHIDSEPAEVYTQYEPEVEVVGDSSAALTGLAQRCGAFEFETEWYDSLREQLVADVHSHDLAEKTTVRAVLPVLREAMADEAVLVSDVGSHKMAIAENFPTYEPNTTIISNGLATMGIGVPGGIAADLATEDDVVVATGDGGFLMNAAEIETATRLGVGYTIIVFRDDDYGLISETQLEARSEAVGTTLGNPDLVAFAESFGIDAYRGESESELREIFAQTIPVDQMALVEIPLDG